MAKVLSYVQAAGGSIDVASQLPSQPAGGATAVHLQAETQDVRYRLDGVNPTTAAGTLLAAGSDVLLEGVPIANIRVIARIAGAVLNITYFGNPEP